MSRPMHARLSKLEARKAPREGLAMVPFADWPAEDDKAAWDRLSSKHPEAVILLPEQAPSIEAWEAAGYE